MGIAGLWYITTMNGNFLFTVRDSILVGRRKALRWSLLKRSNKAGGGMAYVPGLIVATTPLVPEI